MSYTQLTLKQRFRLEIWSEGVMLQKEMAERLGVDPGTVSREFGRNGGRTGYDARRAEALARRVRKRGRRKTKTLLVDTTMRAQVEELLQKTYSPEQIMGKVRREGGNMACHETIYAFIFLERPEWRRYLRQKKGRYRRRGGTKRRERVREEGKKKRIDTRPAPVETRERFGDWEGDTIVGGEKTSGILTHVERKSGYLFGDLFQKKSAEWVRERTVWRFAKLPKHKKHTVTYDNGSEFSDHERIERLSGMRVYFAYPYHSWERGTNENTNGLLRQFFPKKMKFGTLTQKDVDEAVALINHRPRKRLGYLTPHEVFVEGKSVALQGRM